MNARQRRTARRQRLKHALQAIVDQVIQTVQPYREFRIACGGLCCRRFHLPHTPEMLQTYPERFTDGEQIAAMVIPIEPSENGWWYTCRNLQEDGLCAVYETRPAMCREYPYGDQCMFPGCPMYTEPGTGGRDETAVAEHTP